MKVNEKTLLFEGMTPEDCDVVRQVAEGIIFNGTTPWPYPEWLAKWFKAGKFDENQSLLVISTVFPQRALVSVLRAQGLM